MLNPSITYCSEIGSGHCQSLPLALAHMKTAREAGATAIKVQLFRANSLDSRPGVQAQLCPYELPLPWVPILSAACRDAGLLFGVTPFAVDLVEPLRGLVDFVKISAYDICYDDLIATCAGLGVPLVLSTAMANEAEIARAIQICRENSVVLLHGVAQYPARLEDQNLACLPRLRQLGEGLCQVGLSDHTHGPEAAMGAVSLGARWIEKHFKIYTRQATTLLGRVGYMDNPDFEVASEPWEFAYMVGSCNRILQALGDGQKKGPLPCEQPLYDTCRRSNARPLRGDYANNL
jgi:sialic acid synthase SpsE